MIMGVKELHRNLVDHFTQFFDDFNYRKVPDQVIFRQEQQGVHKLISLNLIDYQDGLIIEFMLGIQHNKVEYQLGELLGKAQAAQIQFTYYQYLDELEAGQAKRSFLNPQEPFHHFAKKMEGFFVNCGFYWLDEFAKPKKLSDQLALKIIHEDGKHLNLKLATIRSLLLKKELQEPITEDLYYTYLEIMQEGGVPESEIKAYLQLKKLFLTVQ